MTSLGRVVALAGMLCGAAAFAQSHSADGGESVDPDSVENKDREPAGAASPEERRSLEQGEAGAPASVLNKDAPKPGRATKGAGEAGRDRGGEDGAGEGYPAGRRLRPQAGHRPSGPRR